MFLKNQTFYLQIKPKSPHFYYEAPSNITFGSGPKGVVDPYERKLLESEATKDTMCSAKKKGVFAGRDIVSDKLVSSFAGLVFGRENNELEIFNKRCSSSPAKTNDEVIDCKKYALELSSRKYFAVNHEKLDTEQCLQLSNLINIDYLI